MQGVIIEIGSNLYKAINRENGKIYELIPRGKLKKEEITPVVGDMVEFNNQGSIESVLPRKVYIKRPKLANITQMILVVSSKDPKPDLLLLDKQIAFAEFLNVKVVIVLNKIDLDKKQQMQKIKEIYENIGYKVIETQAKEKFGIDELCYVISNNINAFSGNSGVGKSSIIKSILKNEDILIGDIASKTNRGKHTTKYVKLYKLNEGSYIFDTPGFSSYELYNIEHKKLKEYYPEFFDCICEYDDCRHVIESEKVCNVKSAVKSGKIDKGRYERYVYIYNKLKENYDRRYK